MSEFSAAARRAIRGLFCDIDDTLSTEGRITAEAYAGLQQLQQAGLRVIPVTGRPAGWCDHIARMWPVDAVIGENGAFYFRYDRAKRRMLRCFVHDAATRAQHRARLDDIAREILAAVPGAAIAADQAYRETDLAIDFCEDVPPLPQTAIDEIVLRMQRHGLTARQSSIHVNGWFGHYDKLGMAIRLIQEVFALDPQTVRASYTFVGDSPNDASMFAYFVHAVGVANIEDFADRVPHLPAYITRARCGAGFAEVVSHLLGAGRAP